MEKDGSKAHEPNGHELILAQPRQGGRKQAPSKARGIPSAAGVCGTAPVRV